MDYEKSKSNSRDVQQAMMDELFGWSEDAKSTAGGARQAKINMMNRLFHGEEPEGSEKVSQDTLKNTESHGTLSATGAGQKKCCMCHSCRVRRAAKKLGVKLDSNHWRTQPRDEQGRWTEGGGYGSNTGEASTGSGPVEREHRTATGGGGQSGGGGAGRNTALSPQQEEELIQTLTRAVEAAEEEVRGYISTIIIGGQRPPGLPEREPEEPGWAENAGTFGRAVLALGAVAYLCAAAFKASKTGAISPGAQKKISELANRVSKSVGRLFGRESSTAIHQGIRATQEVMPGTNIPQSFVIEGVRIGNNEVWVHGNATKHMQEFVAIHARGSVLVERELMASFKDAINIIVNTSLQPGRNVFNNVNGWEIIINADTGVIYHALFR